MKYQKIINLLDDATNQPSKFRTKNWVEINDESRETYNANSDIKFKTSMITSNLRGYSDVYIHVKEIITVQNTAAAAALGNNTNKKVIFEDYAPFTNCEIKRNISEINNTQVDDAQDVDWQ